MVKQQTQSDASVTELQKVVDLDGSLRSPSDDETRQDDDGAFDVSSTGTELVLDTVGKKLLDIAWKGGNGDYVLKIQSSPDGDNWFDSGETIETASGTIAFNLGFRYARVVVDTAGTGDLDLAMGAS